MVGIYTAEIVEEAEPPFSLGKQKKNNILVTRCFLHYFVQNNLLEIL